ncbi:histone H3.v1-like [Eriocheir sinensis]|uniref:histone H3.v1-like n=1 Tax=Eriocheir sinensis TaxID=95602 RepID=UPI0021C7E994|nr:histone H3.v1-like [Eriocheir sinensis]
MYFCETASFVRVVKGLLPAEAELEAPTTAFPFLKLFRRYSTGTTSLPQHLADGDHEEGPTPVKDMYGENKQHEMEHEKRTELLELLQLEETYNANDEEEEEKEEEEEEEEVMVKVEEEEDEEEGKEKKEKEEEEKVGMDHKEQDELSLFLELMEVVAAQEEALKKPPDLEQITQRKGKEEGQETEGASLKEQDELSLFLELQELVAAQEEALRQPKDGEQVTQEEEEEKEGVSPREQDELSLLHELVAAQERALEELEGAENIRQKPRKRVTFSLDNLDLPVKERELYEGREYFRCGRRLLTLRPELRREDNSNLVGVAPPRRPSRIPVPRPARRVLTGNTTQPPCHVPPHTAITPITRPVGSCLPIPCRTHAHAPSAN